MCSLNGSCGPSLHPQQLRDRSIALLVKVQSGDPFDVSDSRLMEPHAVLDPAGFSFCALSTPNKKRHQAVQFSTASSRAFFKTADYQKASCGHSWSSEGETTLVQDRELLNGLISHGSFVDDLNYHHLSYEAAIDPNSTLHLYENTPG